MKNKKGFTLIELLAVIVVLAIIALIATPIVMNTIKNAKKGAAERSADNYVKAVEQKVAESRIDGTKIANGTYSIQPDGNLCPTAGCGENDKDKITIDMSGNKPTSGTVTIKNGQVANDSKMTVGDYDVKYNEDNKKYEATEKNDTTSSTYANGEVVYFNVTTGEKCSLSDYTEAQSSTGVKEGCMKFYTFNDDGKDTINLLLDHNTTAGLVWNSSGSNSDGPSEVLTQLKSDTSSWKGTITPENYTMDQSTQSNKANYTIDYSDYKARLITAQEIATITDYSGWDEKVAANSNWYYFDSKTTSSSTTCKNGDTSGCAYGWLYDRTHKSCTDRGCLNNSDQYTSGYWTSSSSAVNTSDAWRVAFSGTVNNSTVVNNSVDYGVRPVIEVLKSKLD